MAGHGSPAPEDRSTHPGRQVGRKPWGEGGPHPSLSDATVEAVRQKVARNAAFRRYDPDTIEEGRQLQREQWAEERGYYD